MCDISRDYDFDFVSFPRKDITAARKQHHCEECRRKIEVGDSYTSYPGIFEGDFFTVALCIRCTKATSWLLGRGHGWMAGEILDDVRYCAAAELHEKREKQKL